MYCSTQIKMEYMTWKQTHIYLKTNKHILVVGELLSDGGEVHGLLDNLPVSRDGFLVDRREERPSVLMGLQLSQQHSGHKVKNIIWYNFNLASPIDCI